MSLYDRIAEQAKEVERLLRPEEKCTFASDALLLKNGKKKPRKLAIVINTKIQSEACVFILEDKRKVTLIVGVYPILNDFAVEPGGCK